MNKNWLPIVLLVLVGCGESARIVYLDGSVGDASADPGTAQPDDLVVNPIFAMRYPDQLEIVAGGDTVTAEYSARARLELPNWAQHEIDRELLQTIDAGGADAGANRANRSERLRRYFTHWAEWLVAHPPVVVGAGGTVAVVRAEDFPDVQLRLTLNPPVPFGARSIILRVRDHSATLPLFVRGTPFSLDQTYATQGILHDFERSNRTVNRCAISSSGAPVFLAGSPPDDTMPNWVRETGYLPSVAWLGDVMVQCLDRRLQKYSTQRGFWQAFDGFENVHCHAVGNLESGELVLVSRANVSQIPVSVDVFSAAGTPLHMTITLVDVQLDGSYPALITAGTASRFAVEMIGSVNVNPNKSEIHFCDARTFRCTRDAGIGVVEDPGFAYLFASDDQRVRVRNVNMESTDASQRSLVAEWTGNHVATLATEVVRLPVSAFVGTDRVLRAYTGTGVASVSLRDEPVNVSTTPASELIGTSGPMIKHITYDASHNRIYTCHENGQVRRFWL